MLPQFLLSSIFWFYLFRQQSSYGLSDTRSACISLIQHDSNFLIISLQRNQGTLGRCYSSTALNKATFNF